MTEENFKNAIMKLPLWQQDGGKRKQKVNNKETKNTNNYLASLIMESALKVENNKDSSDKMSDYSYVLHLYQVELPAPPK